MMDSDPNNLTPGSAPIPDAEPNVPQDANVEQSITNIENAPVTEAPEAPAADVSPVAAETASAPIDTPAAPQANESVQSTMNPVSGEHKSKSGRLIAVVIILVLLIGGFIFMAVSGLFGKGAGKKTAESEKAFTADAVFIREKESEGNYALFNIKTGEQISEFIFDKYSDFVDGYAMVSRESDDAVGIIKDNGDMKVDFGEYEEIKAFCGAYNVSNADGRKVILGNGKQISKAEDTVESDSVFCDYEYPFFIYDNGTNSSLYAYNGKELMNGLPGSDKLDLEYLETTDYEADDELAIRSGDTLVVLDSQDGSVAFQATIPEDYELDTYSPSLKAISVKIDGDEDASSALYINGELHKYTSDECAMLSPIRPTYDKDVVLCIYQSDDEEDGDSDDYYSRYYNSLKVRMVNSDGSLSDKAVFKYDYVSSVGGLPVSDENTFALLADNVISFYKNGTVANTLPSDKNTTIRRVFGSAIEAYQLVEANDDGDVTASALYNFDGKKISDIDKRCSAFVFYFGKDFGICQGKVESDDDSDEYSWSSSDEIYYIVNGSGEITLGGYADVVPINMNAVATVVKDYDDNYGAIDSKGKLIIDPAEEKYDGAEAYSIADIEMFQLRWTDDDFETHYDIFKADGTKVLTVDEEAELVESVNPNKIIKVEESSYDECKTSSDKACDYESVTYFYTLDGKLIYKQVGL